MSDATPWLAHMVYFKLKDASSEAVDRLQSAAREHLSGHDGTRLFAVGTLAKDLDRPVNDHGFDVALQLVFESRAAHDAYQVSERHQKFIEQNKDNWESVRVFDANVSE